MQRSYSIKYLQTESSYILQKDVTITMFNQFSARNQCNCPPQHMKGEKLSLDGIVKIQH